MQKQTQPSFDSLLDHHRRVGVVCLVQGPCRKYVDVVIDKGVHLLYKRVSVLNVHNCARYSRERRLRTTRDCLRQRYCLAWNLCDIAPYPSVLTLKRFHRQCVVWFHIRVSRKISILLVRCLAPLNMEPYPHVACDNHPDGLVQGVDLSSLASSPIALLNEAQHPVDMLYNTHVVD